MSQFISEESENGMEVQKLHKCVNEFNEEYDRLDRQTKNFLLRKDLLLVREKIVNVGTLTIDKMTKYERMHLLQLYQRNDEDQYTIMAQDMTPILKSNIQFVKRIVKFMEEFYPKMTTDTGIKLNTDGITEYEILKQEIDQLTKRVEHMHQLISPLYTPSTEAIKPPASEIAPQDNSEDNDPYEHLDYMHSKYLENVEEMDDLDDGPYHTNDPRDDCDDLYGDYGYGSNYDGGYDSY